MPSSWERQAAIAGLLFVAVLIASFFTPSTPDIDDSTAKIVQDLADDRDGLIAGAYLGGIASVLFIAFTAGVWSRMRAAEGEAGPSVLTLLGGLGSALVIIIANGILLATVYAAYEGREPDAVRALFELDNTVFLGLGFTSAAFYGGVALSAIPRRSLPSVLAWAAAALAVAFPVSLLGLFSKADDGGALGTVFFIALLVNFLWIVATSIVLLRTSGEPAPAARQPG
jgi:hypothetical protein